MNTWIWIGMGLAIVTIIVIVKAINDLRKLKKKIEKERSILLCPDTHLIVWDEDKYEYSCCRCGDKFVEFKPLPLPTPDEGK